ncbi:unnamed protein product [Bemisia tabaci]|uniref:Uncharacterized protein n=1 Tax=Bemisia tabaci TaxID=7038 RepID=A0A9P0A282_BEMTA|nr:unnamed protein product [Bemisia tabaci]
MTDTEDAHQLEGKLSVKANADRIEGGGGLRPRPRCRSGSNSVRRETPHSPSMRQEHEALKKAFEYLESELQDTADEEPPPTTTQTTQQQQPESQQAATPTQVAWAEQLDDKLRSLARRSQEPGASTAKIEDDGDEGIYEYENGKGDGDGDGDGEGRARAMKVGAATRRAMPTPRTGPSRPRWSCPRRGSSAAGAGGGTSRSPPTIASSSTPAGTSTTTRSPISRSYRQSECPAPPNFLLDSSSEGGESYNWPRPQDL